MSVWKILQIPGWYFIVVHSLQHGCANHATEGKCFCPPIHSCDVTKPPYLLSGELCTSPLHSNRLFVYIVCCWRRGHCFSVLRTRHTDVVGDISGRSYVTEQWHNVPLLRTRGLQYITILLGLRSWSSILH